VIVSNHGGRQLDGAAAPQDMLPRIADRLAGSAEMVLDGGIRRGTDMPQARALGRQVCMAGRIGLYGLGPARAARCAPSSNRDLALLDVTTATSIRRQHVTPTRAF
jgi:isopentenyl diphosphate isomerase/L-lactate dehydrogenase-like FMN-dependent dehydrogenase